MLVHQRVNFVWVSVWAVQEIWDTIVTWPSARWRSDVRSMISMNLRFSCTPYVFNNYVWYVQNAHACNECRYIHMVCTEVVLSGYCIFSWNYTIMCSWACAIRCFFLLIVLLNLSKCQMPELNKCDQELLVVFIGLRFHIKYDIS